MNTTDDQKDVLDKPAGRRRSCLGCMGRGVIGLLIFLASLMLVGGIYQATASANDSKKFSPPGKIYNIGDYRLHLYCTGKGSPTVILEAGAGNPALAWYFVQGDVTKFNRVCAYDRPGYGWSEPASGPLSRQQVATTLHQLLETADVPGPYILVGHSAGGEYIRAYARQYPSDVVGMVFVDSSHESQNLRFPLKFQQFSQYQLGTEKICQALSPFGMARVIRLWNGWAPESLLSSDIGDAVLSTMYRTAYCKAAYSEDSTLGSPGQPGEPGSLGDLPLIVLSAGALYDGIPASIVTAMGGPDGLAQVNQVHDDLQQELVSLSTQGKQIIAEKSGHNIHWDQPDLVIDAIREILAQVRSE